MNGRRSERESLLNDAGEPVEAVAFDFGLDRRQFVQVLGAGLLVSVAADPASGQRRGGRGSSRPANISARIHVGTNERITVLTGKVEMGQGARAELSQAAAEELRVSVEQIEMLMGETGQVPDDGTTAGSRTTPGTVPAVRAGAAAAREALMQLACQRWQASAEEVQVGDGKVIHSGSQRALTYGELAQDAALAERFNQAIPEGIALTPVQEWKVLGTSVPRPNRRALVTGEHRFPSDLVRPGMLRGKVLRPPACGAQLLEVDLGPAQAMQDVIVVRDGDFVGVAAPTAFRAEQAIAALAKTAKWQRTSQPASAEIFEYLRQNVQDRFPSNPFAEELARAQVKFRQAYHVAYVQHAPLEPRAAVAEWQDGKLTVWAGTQSPFGYHGELSRVFRLPSENVRVIVPDFGSGFGGKHTAEAAVEAARLARGAGRPVALRWTREEEFTWAYFRPAAVIDIEAGLDGAGKLTSWHFVNVNSGSAAIETPYRAGNARSRFVPAESPLRIGSYRALAATANNFARECCMDELAQAAGQDPLDFRLSHLEHPRLRAVLEEAARRFGWQDRVARKEANVGVGLACGTEKGSYVAACVEIRIDPQQKRIEVLRVCEVFECGAILNPDNLLAQVQACILMGLGPALREEMVFENGEVLNASFAEYHVPRWSDVPPLDIHLLNRPDLESAGGGETPIIAIAPAIANAVWQATGQRVRNMPIRLG
jgi:isoquinoline 1-oxidoreductase